MLEVEERVKYVDLNLPRRQEGSWSHLERNEMLEVISKLATLQFIYVSLVNDPTSEITWVSESFGRGHLALILYLFCDIIRC